MLLSKESFGQIFSLFSLVSIVGLIVPFGSNSYYLTDRDNYVKHARAIQLFPQILAAAIALIFFFARPSMQSCAAGFLLIATTSSIQGILAGQINQSSSQAAIFQSIPSLIKAAAALALLVVSFSPKGPGSAMADRAVSWSLITFSICAIFLIEKNSKSNALRVNWVAFLKSISRKSSVEMLSFWASTVLGMLFSLGITPLTAKFHGYALSGYLGVYFIFWSANNIGITSIINNHFWPKISILRNKKQNLGEVLKMSFIAASLLAAISLLGTTGMAWGVSERIWTNFPGIQKFLIICAIALWIRTYSAWIGMMLLSFEGMIKFKAGVQFLGVLLMVFLVTQCEGVDPEKVAWIMVAVEAFGLLGYLGLGVGVKKLGTKYELSETKK
ncbi:hypothetical protein ACSFBM_01580 [Variovorax sp. GB1R11]|uniref:hypothetical protein n=1 Tax=Variovorax sp. GB1R11 TaxID=3443741 RepID=UPI003F456700